MPLIQILVVEDDAAIRLGVEDALELAVIRQRESIRAKRVWR